MANQAQKTGMSLSTVLLIIFVTLKLTHNIDWAWIWVLAPFWISGLAMLTTMLVSFVLVTWFLRD